MSRLFLYSCFATAIVGAVSSLRGDLPPPPPYDHEELSPNGQFVAKITAVPPKLAVYPVKRTLEEPRWTLDGYHWLVSLADDGEHLIVRDDNFIETKDPGHVVLTFVEHGRLVREVTLGQILPDLSKMWRSASSWNWGFSLPGLNDHGEFAVTTVDYRILYFDVKTGQLLRKEWNYLEQLRDLLGIRAGLRTPVVLFFLGAIIGVGCRGRIVVGLVVTLVLCAALLLFVLWAEGTFVNMNTLDANEREFTSGARSFIQSMSILYLVPSTFSVLVTSFLSRRIRKKTSNAPRPTGPPSPRLRRDK